MTESHERCPQCKKGQLTVHQAGPEDNTNLPHYYKCSECSFTESTYAYVTQNAFWDKTEECPECKGLMRPDTETVCSTCNGDLFILSPED
jgi:hypothetical protein